MSIDKSTRINQQIRVPEVRLIDSDGGQLGIVPMREALRRAEEQGLDLVEVAASARPPVCRLMDFGKFLYQQKKKAHESKRKQHNAQLKEVKFRPNIDDHDYAFKLKNVLRFLDDGDKVKATVQFRGREMARTEAGRRLLERVTRDAEANGMIESPPELNGNRMHLILAPRRQPGPKGAGQRAEG